MTIVQTDDIGAYLAHELSNPIAVVRMAAGSLRKLLADEWPHATELVRVIEDQAALGGRLVDGLLSLAKAERAPWREAFDLGDVIDDAAGGIVVDNRCRGVVVEADALGVRQAVANLVANGVRHGGGELTVWCDEWAGGWRVHVADRGAGLADDDRQRVFHAFERGSRAGEGTGLGLAVVAAMARAHGGEAGCDPRPGGGSDFWFEVRRLQCRGARLAS